MLSMKITMQVTKGEFFFNCCTHGHFRVHEAERTTDPSGECGCLRAQVQRMKDLTLSLGLMFWIKLDYFVYFLYYG